MEVSLWEPPPAILFGGEATAADRAGYTTVAHLFGILERADIRGVFVFRLERPEALNPMLVAGARRTADGVVPVIYRLNLADATGFFAAQDFAVHDKDVIYVSTAPAAGLPKFPGTISSVAFTTIGIVNLVK